MEKIQLVEKVRRVKRTGMVGAMLELYYEMLDECAKRIDQSLLRYIQIFTDILHLPTVPAVPSELELLFDVDEAELKPVYIPKDTIVAVKNGEELFEYLTQDEAEILPGNKITQLCNMDAEQYPRFIEFCYDRFFAGYYYDTAFKGSFQYQLFKNKSENIEVRELADQSKFKWEFILEACDGTTKHLPIHVQSTGKDTFDFTICDLSSGIGRIRLNFLTDEYIDDAISGTFNMGAGLPLPPRAVFIRDNLISPTLTFAPFGKPFNNNSLCFLDCGVFLANPDIDFQLTFDVTFNAMAREGFIVQGGGNGEAFATDINFSYWNGEAFVSFYHIDAFIKEEGKDKYHYEIPVFHFRDIHPFYVAGQERLVIRISCGECDGLYIKKKVYSPLVSGLICNPIKKELKPNHINVGRSGLLKPLETQDNPIFNSNPRAPKGLYIGFDRFSESGNQSFFVLQNSKSEGSNRINIYNSTTNEKINIDDDTNGLTQSGRISLKLRNSPEKTALFGKECFWFRIKANRDTLRWDFELYTNTITAKNIYTIEQQYFADELTDGVIHITDKQLISLRLWVNTPNGWEEWQEANPYDAEIKYRCFRVDNPGKKVYLHKPVSTYLIDGTYALKISAVISDGKAAKCLGATLKLKQDISEVKNVSAIYIKNGMDCENESCRVKRDLDYLRAYGKPGWSPVDTKENELSYTIPEYLPRLDFETMVNQAVKRIPLMCPEWTDFNAQDTGIMLLELGAAFVEALGYDATRFDEEFLCRYVELMTGRGRDTDETVSQYIGDFLADFYSLGRAISNEEYERLLIELDNPILEGVEVELEGNVISIKAKKEGGAALDSGEKRRISEYLDMYRPISTVVKVL